jgi:hypothetical protein
MSGDDIRLYLANIFAFTISLSEIEQVLQIVVLSATLVYTCVKIIQLLKPKK